MESMLEVFFRGTEEKQLNKLLLEGKAFQTGCRDYIIEICKIPLEQYVAFVYEKCRKTPVLSPDIFQFSSFEDASFRFCSILSDNTRTGYHYNEIGAILQNDGIERNENAKSKYGENHSKTAEILGLAFSLDNKHYLSACGAIFSELPEETQKKFLVRCTLRSKLVIRLLLEERDSSRVNVEVILYDISESTYKRRKSNIRTILNILKDSIEYDFNDFVSHLIL